MEHTITNRETVFSEGPFKVEKLNVKSEEKEFERYVFDRGNAAAALVHDTVKNKFIFVEQYRAGAEGLMVEIVAGGMEEGEKTQDTIKREIAEELGYKVDNLTHITDFYVSPGANKEVTALFFAEVSEKIDQGGGVDDEEIVLVEVDDLGMNGNLFFEPSVDGEMVPPYKLIDAKSIIAVNWYAQNKMMKNLWETVSTSKMKSL